MTNSDNAWANFKLGVTAMVFLIVTWIAIALSITGIPWYFVAPVGFIIGLTAGNMPTWAMRYDWRTKLNPAYRWLGRD